MSRLHAHDSLSVQHNTALHRTMGGCRFPRFGRSWLHSTLHVASLLPLVVSALGTGMMTRGVIPGTAKLRRECCSEMLVIDGPRSGDCNSTSPLTLLADNETSGVHFCRQPGALLPSDQRADGSRGRRRMGPMSGFQRTIPRQRRSWANSPEELSTLTCGGRRSMKVVMKCPAFSRSRDI